MKNLDSCRFCNIVTGDYKYADVDCPFSSNDEFIAIPSIGALVEGWSLVIPKRHQLSMKSVYNHSSFKDFLSQILPILLDQYGPFVAFEHGANKEGSITACGTDHAHLHLVPLRESLLIDLQNSGLSWARCHTSEIALRTERDEYLFYYELGVNKIWHDPIGYLHILKQPISQYFRHLIATRKGLLDVSDYRKFPHIEIAKRTQQVLAGSIV